MIETNPIRILLVDDEPLSLTLLGKHLADAGHSVLTAAHGKEALRILLSEGPQMVITDWMMPEMDGLELCRAVRSHEGIAFAYLVILTAHTDEEHILEAFEAGADDYLRKPFNHRELLARVRAGGRIIRLQSDLERHTREAHRFNAEMAVGNDKLEEVNRKLNFMATTDELTGLVNRREAMARLRDHWSASLRHGDPLSCIALDIDHFKACNDNYGHAVGDLVLKETAEVLRRTARQGESVCRFGGEEFLVLCPNSTEPMAEVAAERIRREVEGRIIRVGDISLRVTLSAGVAERTTDMSDPDEILRVADTALYAAKDAGRNTVCLASKIRRPTNTVPVPEANASPSGMPPMRNPELPTKIMVADTDAGFRSTCIGLLRREGYEVIEAVNASDLSQKVECDIPEVILVDTSLCESDEMECVRRLKTDPQTHQIPIIMTTARKDGRDVTACLKAGADEYLKKPAHPQELILRVNTMARYRRELIRSNSVRGEQSRALDLLVTFSRDITAAHTLDAVLEATVTAVSAMTCSRRVCVFLPDDEGTHLRLALALGLDEETTAKIRFPTSEGTAGRAFRTREKVFYNTAEEARAHKDDPDYQLFPGTPCVFTPLCAPECTVGVLGISGRQQARPFAESDLDYIDLICNIAAAAIHDCLTRRARDEARDSIVVALAKLAESRDMDTGRHLDRVTQFCSLLAAELRTHAPYHEIINDEFLGDLQRAVPLHDIGKVAVPDDILLKPGRLTAEEIEIMRTHAEIGARTIRSVIDRAPGARFLFMAEQIARSHHEWHDGRGYPNGLRGETIPLSARIAAVADVYDALTTKRVYKDAIGHEQAVGIILKAAGTQFDPQVVKAFVNCSNEFQRLSQELADRPENAEASARRELGGRRLEQFAGSV